MKSWKNRDSIISGIARSTSSFAKAAPTQEKTKSALFMKADRAAPASLQYSASAPPKLTDELVDWLAKLTLLYGAPFDYIAPDPRLLPNESLRFFYVDRNWLDRLVDGALSVGVLSSKDQVFNQTFFESVYQAIDEKQATLRSDLKGVKAPNVSTVGGQLTGLLFRSVVVSSWPGLEIKATLDKKELPIIRMDRLSSNTLLCIFDGVPDDVEIIEPGEGLHFGLIGDRGADTFYTLVRGLNYPTPEKYPAGEQIPDPNHDGDYIKAEGKFRSGANQPAGVVDIADLKTSIENALEPFGALKGGKLTSGEFAIEMTRGAGLQAYQPNKPECFTEPNK